jgi:hypothetical protein
MILSLAMVSLARFRRKSRTNDRNRAIVAASAGNSRLIFPVGFPLDKPQ